MMSWLLMQWLLRHQFTGKFRCDEINERVSASFNFSIDRSTLWITGSPLSRGTFTSSVLLVVTARWTRSSEWKKRLALKCANLIMTERAMLFRVTVILLIGGSRCSRAWRAAVCLWHGMLIYILFWARWPCWIGESSGSVQSAAHSQSLIMQRTQTQHWLTKCINQAKAKADPRATLVCHLPIVDFTA